MKKSFRKFKAPGEGSGKEQMMFKKVLALAMSLCMVFAMSATAFASNYNVSIYKSGSSTLSMADDIIAGNATVTIDGSTATIEIPIQPITDYKPMGFLWAADGYLRSLTVSNATSATVTSSSDFYTNATLTIIMPTASLPTSDGKLSITSCNIDLYLAGTQNSYPLYSHLNKPFDLVLDTSLFS